MTDASPAERVIDFLKAKILRDSAIEIHEDTPLVSSGLVDSFALIEVLLHLESVTGRRISPGKVSPRDMETVRLMLLTAERVGRART